MAKYYGGQLVKKGYYLNRATLEFEPIAKEAGKLPGDKETIYTRLPLPTVATITPLLGLTLVIFLPMVGIIGLAALLGYRTWQLAQLLGRKMGLTHGAAGITR